MFAVTAPGGDNLWVRLRFGPGFHGSWPSGSCHTFAGRGTFLELAHDAPAHTTLGNPGRRRRAPDFHVRAIRIHLRGLSLGFEGSRAKPLSSQGGFLHSRECIETRNGDTGRMNVHVDLHLSSR